MHRLAGTYYKPEDSEMQTNGENSPLLGLGAGGVDEETGQAYSPDYGEARISRFLREVSLSEKDADELTEGYSGGMKRKLSVAITLITDPTLVFLDEMSAGVDIVAQQALWNKIIHRPQAQTIITTTHSMMEADAVSDRLGILVQGKLKCLGTTSIMVNLSP